jgi:hypothetical protein
MKYNVGDKVLLKEKVWRRLHHLCDGKLSVYMNTFNPIVSAEKLYIDNICGGTCSESTIKNPKKFTYDNITDTATNKFGITYKFYSYAYNVSLDEHFCVEVEECEIIKSA